MTKIINSSTHKRYFGTDGVAVTSTAQPTFNNKVVSGLNKTVSDAVSVSPTAVHAKTETIYTENVLPTVDLDTLHADAEFVVNMDEVSELSEFNTDYPSLNGLGKTYDRTILLILESGVQPFVRSMLNRWAIIKYSFEGNNKYWLGKIVGVDYYYNESIRFHYKYAEASASGRLEILFADPEGDFHDMRLLSIEQSYAFEANPITIKTAVNTNVPTNNSVGAPYLTGKAIRVIKNRTAIRTMDKYRNDVPYYGYQTVAINDAGLEDTIITSKSGIAPVSTTQ